MKRHASMLLLLVLFNRLQAQMVVTDFGTSTSNNPGTYSGYNNTGLSPAVFGGTGIISNSNPSNGYTGASGGSNANIHAGENFWVRFNSGANLLLQFSFAYMTAGNQTLSDPYLEYSILPGVFLPLNILSFNNSSSWQRVSSNPFVVLPNTEITLRWKASSIFSSYTLLIDDINFSAMTVLAVKAPDLKAVTQPNKTVLSWEPPSEEFSHLSLERAEQADGKYRTIFETTSAADNSYTDQQFSAVAHYRIRVTDREGAVAYSRAIRISREANAFVLTSTYPNPASGSNIWLKISSATAVAAQCRIVDLRGNTVGVQQVQLKAGEGNYSIDISRLNKGVHFIQVISESRSGIQQFVKE